MNPSIGYGIRTLTTKDVNRNSEISEDETLLRFGVENRF